MTRSDLINALACPNVGAFLALIREGETNQTPNAYRMQWGSGLFYPEREWKHPNQPITINGITSTAAGAYQFLAKTWLRLVEQYGFEDFSPAMQDLGAVALIAGRGALDAVKAGRVHEAIRLCNKEWASLPGNPYGQPAAKLSRLLAAYTAAGGTITDDPTQKTQPEVKPMPIPAILGAVLPALFQAAPDLIRLFGKGEQSQKNAAVAEKVAEVAKDVTGAINEQEAAEKIANDPQAAQAFREAVAMNFDQWLGMTMKFADMDEASRAKAREFATGYAREPVLGRLTFIELLSLLMMTIAATGGGYVLWGNFPAEIKGAVVTMMFLGGWNGVKEFWFGSSYGSRTKDSPPK